MSSFGQADRLVLWIIPSVILGLSIGAFAFADGRDVSATFGCGALAWLIAQGIVAYLDSRRGY